MLIKSSHLHVPPAPGIEGNTALRNEESPRNYEDGKGVVQTTPRDED